MRPHSVPIMFTLMMELLLPTSGYSWDPITGGGDDVFEVPERRYVPPTVVVKPMQRAVQSTTSQVLKCDTEYVSNTDVRVPFGRIAQKLGIPVKGDDCQFSPGELIQQDEAGMRTTEQWACIMLKENLDRDTKSDCRPDPDVVFKNRFPDDFISGEILYAGIYPGEYQYRLSIAPDGRPLVSLRVNFMGEAAKKPELIRDMREKFRIAALKWSIWSSNVPGGEVHFDFQVSTSERAGPGFNVNLSHDTKGTPRTAYDSSFSTQWDSNTVAHELGHVMGLEDEYNQLRASLKIGATTARQNRCDDASMMCSYQRGVPQLYHYYLILRRRFCKTRPYFDGNLDSFLKDDRAGTRF